MRFAEGGEEVLVVDDDPVSRAAYAAALADAGYRVRQASDGAGCLVAVAEWPPSLILLDVSMPGMDGLETLRRVRKGPHARVPVILVTGERMDAESIGFGLELGAEEYLQKPVRAAELKARIRALLKLAAARRELEALKRDQTAMLVHDLKQPLAVIALRAEFVADESADDELCRSGEAIRDACRQMERIIESVLELSRVEAGQLKLQQAALAVDQLVSEVALQLEGLAQRRGIALAVRACSRPAMAQVDRQKIIQVLQNLLGNALKFTPAGGRIEVRTVSTGTEVLVSVEDSGCGLQPGDAAKVFDKWQQTRVGRSRGGTGLGLAIARAIIEAHGGRIGAGDRVDGARGARFWFVLPLICARLALPAAQATG
jgi:two-component system, sensor histidine kinase and response regulator